MILVTWENLLLREKRATRRKEFGGRGCHRKEFREGGGHRIWSSLDYFCRIVRAKVGGASMDLGLVQEAVKGVFDWWDTVDESLVWQNRIFYSLAGAYGVIALIALIQLIRIELRVPEYGWTTQKVFHLLNFIVNGVRAVVFIFRHNVQDLSPAIWHSVLLDLPGLLFFTTYTLLVLFWAEIYHQARSLPTDNLRPAFLVINAVIYVVQVALWVYLWWTPTPWLLTVSKLFFAGVSLIAAIGFLLYGGRLFLMLRRFPIESKGRRKKLREVGCVTAICFTCFTIRSVIMSFSIFNKEANLNVLDHPILNAIYYTLTEIIPSALVLYILRKLPPKRLNTSQYHPIR